MKPPRGASFVWSIVAFAVVGLTGLVAYASGSLNAARLGVLARARHARLDAPVPGPAVYRGVLVGPSTRRSLAGAPVAAAWWRADRRQGRGRRDVCSGGAQDALVLRADGVEAPVSFMTEGARVFVISRTHDNSWERPIAVDLGTDPDFVTDHVPEAAACSDGRRYYERRLAQGAAVEVFGCFANGAIGPCGGVVAGVVSVGSMRDHRLHRAQDMRDDVRLALVMGIFALTILSVQTLVFAVRTMRVLAPRRRGRKPS